VAVNGIYASIIPSYKYNLVLKSFSYGKQVMGHPVYTYIHMKKNTIKIRNSQNNYGKLYVFNLL
jgi:hypothetical protein